MLIRYAQKLKWKSCKFKNFFTLLSLRSSLFICSHQDNAFETWCFFSDTCQTSKSKSQIHANQQLIRTLSTSVTLQFSCVTRVWVLSSIIKETSYRYVQTFFKDLRRSQHFYFSVLYIDSVTNQISLSYLQTCCHFLSFTIYIRHKSHSFRLEFTVNTIFSISSL